MFTHLAGSFDTSHRKTENLCSSPASTPRRGVEGIRRQPGEQYEEERDPEVAAGEDPKGEDAP